MCIRVRCLQQPPRIIPLERDTVRVYNNKIICGGPTIKHLSSIDRPAFGKHSTRRGEVPCGQCSIHTSDLGSLSRLLHGTGNGTHLLIIPFVPRSLRNRRVL